MGDSNFIKVVKDVPRAGGRGTAVRLWAEQLRLPVFGLKNGRECRRGIALPAGVKEESDDKYGRI